MSDSISHVYTNITATALEAEFVLDAKNSIKFAFNKQSKALMASIKDDGKWTSAKPLAQF